MAKLGNISNIRVGTIKVEVAEPLSRLPEVEVRLTKEVLPFEMEAFTRTGLETQLAARSLLWSSQNIGAVVRDRDGLFHAVETNIPRLELGDKFSFGPAERAQGSRFDFVELVAVPKVSLKGSSQPASSSNSCFTDSNFNSRRAKTEAGQKLMRKVQEAVREWDKWWTRHVQAGKNPPPPPNEVSQPFLEIIADLLGIQPSEVAVMNKPDELISDQISIDLFDKTVRGKGGSTKADLDRRLESAKKGDLKAVLQLHAEAFRDAVPMLGSLGTGIHEAAHYRHYVLTRQLIAMWHRSSSRSQKSKPVTENVLRGEFGKFVDTLVQRKRLTYIEMTIVHSTFGAMQATHPFAQLNAFMGVYPLYPREFDVAGGKKGRGLADQPRFTQLLKAAEAWASVMRPDVGSLSTQVIAEYAKQQKEKCVKTDLRDLCNEIVALSDSNGFSPGAAKYFKKLLAELNK